MKIFFRTYKKKLYLCNAKQQKKKVVMETNKSVEDFAFEAWKALYSYRQSLVREFFHNIDPLDPEYKLIRKRYYDRYDYVTDMMYRLDVHPNPLNPFDDYVLHSNNY